MMKTMQSLQSQLMKLKEETTGTMYQRGEVYFARLDGVGSEQKGLRPIIILQNDNSNKKSPTLVVATMTTKHKKMELSCHVEVDNGKSIVLCEQLRTIDKARIEPDSFIYRATDEEMQQISDAIKSYLCLF